MKVVLDYRFEKFNGLSRYVDNLAFHLKGSDSISSLKLFDKNVFSGKRKIKGINAFGRLFYEYFIMKYDLEKIGCDIFHCTKNFGVPHSKKIKIVTTIHDIIPLVLRKDYSRSFTQFRFYKHYLQAAIINSDAIITISNFSFNQIVQLFPDAKSKMHIVMQGVSLNHVNDNTKSNVFLEKYKISKPYILIMGGAEPRKNVQFIVNLFSESLKSSDYDVVLVGNRWCDREINIPNNIFFKYYVLNSLSDSELFEAYKYSTVFVYPSIYEGFGLPVLEAMACGTPVLAHNGSSIPEVAGNAAMLIDMRNPEECLRGLQKLLSDKDLRDHYIAAGRERVKSFSWEKTAAQTLDVYKSVL